MDTATKGRIFKIVVINCTLPDVVITKVFIHANSHIVLNAVATAATELVANTGKNVLNALTKAIAILAFEHDTAI